MHPFLRAALAAALSLALPAAAADQPAAGTDPMAAWKPPVVKHAEQDKQELHALAKKMEAASQKGDVEAAAALVDFPVLMVTDNSKGEGMGESWSREQWVGVMKPMYARPMPEGVVTHGKATVILLSDSLALVGAPWAMKMGNAKKVSGTSGLVMIRKGGDWKIKAMVEGGWGDMPMPASATQAEQGK